MSDGYRPAADHQPGEECEQCGALLGFTTLDLWECQRCGYTLEGVRL